MIRADGPVNKVTWGMLKSVLVKHPAVLPGQVREVDSGELSLRGRDIQQYRVVATSPLFQFTDIRPPHSPASEPIPQLPGMNLIGTLYGTYLDQKQDLTIEYTPNRLSDEPPSELIFIQTSKQDTRELRVSFHDCIDDLELPKSLAELQNAKDVTVVNYKDGKPSSNIELAPIAANEYLGALRYLMSNVPLSRQK